MEIECHNCRLAIQTDWSADRKLTADVDVIFISDLTKTPKQQKKILKERRDEKREEIIQKVSALRNSGGGVLFVHFIGLDARNRNLHFFNELVDSRLEKLIEDGSLFVDNYEKIWPVSVGERSYFPKAFEFLLLTVKGSSIVSTYDFKTNVSTDESVNAPTSQNVFQLIYGNRNNKTTNTSNLEPPFFDIDESRYVQLKAFKENEFVDNISSDNLDEFVEFIWVKLRLREYISSLATSTKGGSYLLGINEFTREDLSYKCKTSIPVGVSIDPKLLEDLQSRLLRKINENTLTEPENSSKNFVRIGFHLVVPFVQNFILEVAVSHVTGCVFYDKEGPEAFTVNGMNLQRIPFRRWLEKLQKHNM